MKHGIKSRLAKLEAAAGEPSSPFDDMTADELRVWLIDEAEKLIANDGISEEGRAWLRQILIAHKLGDQGALTRMAIPSDWL